MLGWSEWWMSKGGWGNKCNDLVIISFIYLNKVMYMRIGKVSKLNIFNGKNYNFMLLNFMLFFFWFI